MRALKESLRYKIIAWSFVPTAIIMVAVALVSMYAYQRVTENLVIERDRELTRLSASLLATELATYTDPLTDLSLAAFDGFLVFKGDGTIVAVEPTEYAWLKDVILRHALWASEPGFADTIVDGPAGEKIVVAVIPVGDLEGGPRGGVAGLFRLGPKSDNPLYQSIQRLAQEEGQILYLVDDRGQVIYHSDPACIGQDFSGQLAVQHVTDGAEGAFRTRDRDDQEIVASFAQVPGTSWGLVVEENWAVLIQPSRRYQKLLFLLLIAGIVAPTLIVMFGVKRITQPIAELIAAAQKVAGGNFKQRISAPSGGELEDLAEQFNLMAAQLQASYAGLEQKVADRTRELATLNTIAAKVSQSLDLSEILNSALGEVLAVMGTVQGKAFRLDDESQNLVLMAHQGLTSDFSRLPGQSLGLGATGQAINLGMPVVVPVADYPQGQLKEMLAAAGMVQVVSIPLMANGRARGAIELYTPAPRTITAEEQSLLTAIGLQVGLAVENARLYEQAQQLAVMKERNRLARDLHDSVTQALYGVALCAEAGTRQLSSGEMGFVAKHLREIQTITQEALREMRLLIFELSPPMLRQAGLAAALRMRLEAVEERVGLETELIVDSCGRLPLKLEEGLYRVAQEALNNVLKHAHASRVSVGLKMDQEMIRLEIADNGIGFDPSVYEGGGFGLRGMQDRVAHLGGKMWVQSNHGDGTRVQVEVRQP